MTRQTHERFDRIAEPSEQPWHSREEGDFQHPGPAVKSRDGELTSLQIRLTRPDRRLWFTQHCTRSAQPWVIHSALYQVCPALGYSLTIVPGLPSLGWFTHHCTRSAQPWVIHSPLYQVCPALGDSLTIVPVCPALGDSLTIVPGLPSLGWFTHHCTRSAQPWVIHSPLYQVCPALGDSVSILPVLPSLWWFIQHSTKPTQRWVIHSPFYQFLPSLGWFPHHSTSSAQPWVIHSPLHQICPALGDPVDISPSKADQFSVIQVPNTEKVQKTAVY